jgi:hypothetical protein
VFLVVFPVFSLLGVSILSGPYRTAGPIGCNTTGYIIVTSERGLTGGLDKTRRSLSKVSLLRGGSIG